MTTQPVTHHQPKDNTMNTSTKTISAPQAKAIGRQAADVATAEVDHAGVNPVRPIQLLSGCALQSLRGNQRSRAGVIEAIENYVDELLAERPEVLDDERGDDVIKACDEWLKDLRDALAQQPAAVRVGIEAWVDEHIDGQNLDPDTLTEKD